MARHPNTGAYIAAGETADFAGADIVLLGTGSAADQKRVSAYRADIAQPLGRYIEDGGALLAIGAGYQLLGNFFYADGEKTDGFGVLDIETHDSEKRYIGHFAVEAVLRGETVTLVGFEHHTGKTDIKNYTPFGRVVAGFGNAEDGSEGVFYKNTIGTNMHGPILPKNPALADFMICSALVKKYGEAELAALDDDEAQAARQVVLERVK